MRELRWQHKTDNKGMSLVEIIVVIAILSLFIGSVSYSINWASGKAAEECAQKLAYNLKQARTMAMGKNSTTITVKKDEAGNIITEMKLVTDTGDAATTTSTKVGNRSVSVRFDDGSSESELGTGGVVFVFDRASGALKTLNGAEANTNTASPKFTVSKGSTRRTIEIVPITGRISVGK